jgi:protein-L-isoaspartate O-methyltransferase
MITLDDYRRFYAEEIRVSANLHSPALVEAFALVPREKYLGRPPWQIGSAEQIALSSVGMGAGVTHPHRAWLERLGEGGRLALPITMASSPTAGQGPIVKITREGGAFSAQIVTFVGIISCTSVRDPQLEPLIAKALASRTLFKLKSVRLDAHEPADTCILHGSGVCMSSAELNPTPRS